MVDPGVTLQRRGILAAVLLLAIAFSAGTPAPAGAKEDEEDRAQYTVSAGVAKKLNPALEALTDGDYEESGQLLGELENRAARLKPYERALVYQMFGFQESGKEKYPEALAYFEKCLAEDALPQTAQLQTRFNVAQLYMATEQYEKAVESLELWFARVKDPSASAHYLLAVAYYQMEDPQRAIPPARTAVEVAAEVREPWLQLLVGLYYETKEYAKAEEPLEALIMLNPKKEYWTQLSSLYAHLEKEPMSLAVMQLAYDQGYLEADRELRQLAQLYLYHAIPYRAATVLEKGLEDGVVEEDVDLFAMLANAWLLAREYDKAIAPLEKAAVMSPEGDLYARLGQVQLDREDWNAASEALSAALEKGGLSDPGTAKLMLGMAYYYQRRTAEARRYFTLTLEDESHRETASQWLLLLERELAAEERESADPELDAEQSEDVAPAAGPTESGIS